MGRKELFLLKKVIKNSDVLLEVIDARFFRKSDKLRSIIKKTGKKLVVVLNKADLVGRSQLHWLRRKVVEPSIAFSATKKWNKKALLELIRANFSGETVKVGVVGYPNTGKSSVINALVGGHKASTSPECGHTKGIQWIRVGNLLLFDSPGVIPLRESKTSLLIKGALSPDKEDCVAAAEELIGRLLKNNQEARLFEIYKIPPEGTAEEILERIARRRGRLLPGGVPDVNGVAKMIIRDWQRGKWHAK